MTVAWKPERQIDNSADALLIGTSPAMRAVRELVRQVAPTTASVLITGPSGSGKELVARAIHYESRRAQSGFVAVNCGAIPNELLESELFGHERGSFTGAVSQVRGRFEDANGGTLFLDEIGDMPTSMQVKLLRVLEERAITRVGGRTLIPIDTRIVSATHRNLDVAIEDERFREDLFYRLAVFPISLPSLSERAEDIPLLVAQLTHVAGPGIGHQPRHRLRRDVDRLAPRLPGEMRDFIERAAIIFPGQDLGADEVNMLLHRGQPRRKTDFARAMEAAQCELPLPPRVEQGKPVDLKTLVAQFEQKHIIDALQQSKGVVADAARLLSLQRTTLIEKMQKYGVSRAMA